MRRPFVLVKPKQGSVMRRIKAGKQCGESPRARRRMEPMRRFAFHIAFLFAAALPAFCQGGTWTTQAPMPTPRGNAGAGVVNGILYAVGGCAGSCVIRVNEAYDSVSNTWTTKAPIPNTTAQGGVQQ